MSRPEAFHPQYVALHNIPYLCEDGSDSGNSFVRRGIGTRADGLGGGNPPAQYTSQTNVRLRRRYRNYLA